MPSYVAAANAIRAHLASQFPSDVIVFENDVFNPETDGGEAGFLFCEIEESESYQASIGSPTSNCTRSEFEVRIFVFVPRGGKVGAAEAKAQAIKDAFRPTTLAGLNITDRIIAKAEQVRSRDVSDSRWFGIPVIMRGNFSTVESV